MSKELKTTLMIIGVIVLVIIMIYSFFAGTYNTLVRLDEAVKVQWSQVENVYQRRADLIPNLVETVKGYARHERETLQAVVDARSRVGNIQLGQNVINNPEVFKKFQSAQGELSSALSRMLVVMENYPQLKANENFLNLQAQLEGTENRIAVERKRYNEVVMEYERKRKLFPTRLLSDMYGFKERPYFEAEAGSEKAPKVSF